MRTGTRMLCTAVLLLAAGCGSAGGGPGSAPAAGRTVAAPSAPGTGGGHGTPSATTHPGCGDVVITPRPGDGNGPVCLKVGGTLRVDGGQGATEQGRALTEISPGVYRGARAGAARLSGFVRACPKASPGVMSCHAIAGWKVTVDVR